MPQSPVPNTAQAVLNYNSDSGDARNVLHFQQAPDAPFDNINLQSLAEAVQVWWAANLRQHVAAAFTLESIITRDLANVPGEQHERVVNLAGSAIGNRSPGNVTTVMTLRSAQGGKSGRGRIYHVGLPTGYYLGDVVHPNEKNQLVAAYTALMILPPSGVGPEFQLVVVSRYANLVQRPQGIKNRVTSVSNDGLLDSQRRRLRGRGA